MADPVTSTISSLPAVNLGSPAVTAKNTLDKNSFLKLLTTQLQNQDPTKPMDSTAFVAQLATFSQVEGITNLGTKLDSLLLAQANANQMSVANLVGKQVTFKADHLALTQGQTASFDLSLDAASDATMVNVSDGFGRIVRTLQVGGRPAGSSTVTWDGLDSSGQPLPSGQYSLTVAATRSDGKPVDAASAVRGIVAGIDFDGQVPQLVVAGQRIQLGDVTQIGEPTTP